jgi:hypothetical protein
LVVAVVIAALIALYRKYPGALEALATEHEELQAGE